MDVPRTGVKKRKAIRAVLALISLCALAGGLYAWMRRLEPALPMAEGVWPDTVKRGPMVRQVHGLGTLVPEEVIWISALSEGRVERIFVQPGIVVKPETPIMQLSNPTLAEGLVSAQFELKLAEANLADLAVTLQTGTFDKQAAAAQINADYTAAKLAADRDRELLKLGLIPELDAKLSENKAKQLEFRNQLEEKRLGIIHQSVDAQTAAQKVRIESLKSQVELKRHQVDQLLVRAGVAGVLQQLGNWTAGGTAPPLEAGQNVAAGAILAKIAQQDKLKAQVKITETEAKDVTVGLAASIDTRNGVIPGRVARIDPAAVGGTVLVDVALSGKLPAGARPDLSVDGTIDIERLNDVVYMVRPAVGQPNSTVTLFRFDADGKTASRVSVRLGRASVGTVEVLQGLAPGDRVIVSDMSRHEQYDKVAVK
jgi:HlyD family secretion protein